MGHSLGAATATLVSYAAQQYLNEQLAEAAPVVDAVLVAPPNAGPSGFVEAFNQLVNARSLAFEYDIIPQALCTPSMPACGPSDGGSLGGLVSPVSALPHVPCCTCSLWYSSQLVGAPGLAHALLLTSVCSSEA